MLQRLQTERLHTAISTQWSLISAPTQRQQQDLAGFLNLPWLVPPFKLCQIWSSHFSEAADCQLNLSPCSSDNGADATDHVFSPLCIYSLAAGEDSSVSAFKIWKSFFPLTRHNTGQRQPKTSQCKLFTVMLACYLGVQELRTKAWFIPQGADRARHRSWHDLPSLTANHLTRTEQRTCCKLGVHLYNLLPLQKEKIEYSDQSTSLINKIMLLKWGIFANRAKLSLDSHFSDYGLFKMCLFLYFLGKIT